MPYSNNRPLWEAVEGPGFRSAKSRVCVCGGAVSSLGQSGPYNTSFGQLITSEGFSYLLLKSFIKEMSPAPKKPILCHAPSLFMVVNFFVLPSHPSISSSSNRYREIILEMEYKKKPCNACPFKSSVCPLCFYC